VVPTAWTYSNQFKFWPPQPHQHLHPHSACHLGNKTYPLTPTLGYKKSTLTSLLCHMVYFMNVKRNFAHIFCTRGSLSPWTTGHVIQRMRSGCIRILNGNQWKTLQLVTQEWIGVGSSYLVARLITWLAIYDNCSRSNGQRSRSQGHITYQPQECNKLAVGGQINFKLV